MDNGASIGVPSWAIVKIERADSYAEGVQAQIRFRVDAQQRKQESELEQLVAVQFLQAQHFEEEKFVHFSQNTISLYVLFITEYFSYY